MYSKTSFSRECCRLLRKWREGIDQRLPSSSAGNDTTVDSTRRRPTRNRTMETLSLVQSKTEASRPRSYSTSTCKPILASKGRFDQPTTSSSTTRTTSTSTYCSKELITSATSTFVRQRRLAWSRLRITPTWLASVLDATSAGSSFRRATRANAPRNKCLQTPRKSGAASTIT